VIECFTLQRRINCYIVSSTIGGQVHHWRTGPRARPVWRGRGGGQVVIFFENENIRAELRHLSHTKLYHPDGMKKQKCYNLLPIFHPEGMKKQILHVIPTNVGIYNKKRWIPVYTGMTVRIFQMSIFYYVKSKIFSLISFSFFRTSL